jgi:hypothetical protein
MFARVTAALLTSALLALAARAGPAVGTGRPAPTDAGKALKPVRDRLAELKGESGRVEPITDGALAEAFPGHRFCAVLYRRWPLVEPVPAPLKHSSIFAVAPGDTLTLLTDVKGLEAYFKANLGAVKEDKAARAAALAYLRLAEQLYQDGFYKFKAVAEATKVEAEGVGKKAGARSTVMAGGNGEVTVALTFDGAGKLVRASEKSTVKPGPRPRCHATKLLDPDPVVRAIVEQDLLIMGRAAKGYLDEQRAKADPQLRQAIDRIWQRILSDDGG